MSFLRNICLPKTIMILYFVVIYIGFFVLPFEFGSMFHLELIIEFGMRNGLRFRFFFFIGNLIVTTPFIKNNVTYSLLSNIRRVIKISQYKCSGFGLQFTSIFLFVYTCTNTIPCGLLQFYNTPWYLVN